MGRRRAQALGFNRNREVALSRLIRKRFSPNQGELLPLNRRRAVPKTRERNLVTFPSPGWARLRIDPRCQPGSLSL